MSEWDGSDQQQQKWQQILQFNSFTLKLVVKDCPCKGEKIYSIWNLSHKPGDEGVDSQLVRKPDVDSQLAREQGEGVDIQPVRELGVDNQLAGDLDFDCQLATRFWWWRRIK